MDQNNLHEYWMAFALEEAKQAEEKNEVPVGCVIIQNSTQKIISKAHNFRENSNKSTAHAELLAIDQACDVLKSWRLLDCSLYVTLEPCLMCSGAILLSRIPFVIYGCADPKAGAVHSLFQTLNDERLNHRCCVMANILNHESSSLLKNFFKGKRKIFKKTS